MSATGLAEPDGPSTWVDRPEVVRAVDDWWGDPDAPRLLVVAGRFGTGKSVVLAQIAEHLRTDPDVVVVERLRLRGADRTLAASDPDGFVSGVSEALHGALGRGHHLERNAGGAHFHLHFAGPVGSVTPVEGDATSLAVARWAEEVVPRLRDAVAAGTRPVLVLDALDELDGALVDALTDRVIPELQAGTRVVVSGRPDLPTALTAPGGVAPVVISLDDAEAGADDDIARYAASRLHHLGFHPGTKVSPLVNQIVANAEGKFLYARWVLDDLAADPGVDLATWAPPPGMTALYDQFLARVQRVAGDRWPEVAEVLASIGASFDPGLSVGQLAELHGLEVPRLRRWLRDWCGHYLETDARDRVRVGHASLATHWVDAERHDAGPIGVDPGDVHDRLAHWCTAHGWVATTPEYAVRNAVAHAAAATVSTTDEALAGPRATRLARIATTWDWLAERHRRHGTTAVLGDLALAVSDSAGVSGPEAALARSLETVARREAHHLAGVDGAALAQQLLVTAVRWHEAEVVEGLRHGTDRTGRSTGLSAFWCDRPADRLLTVLTGHTDWVRGVCTLSDGRIVSAGDDATLRVWDPDRPDTDPIVLTGHTGAVFDLSVLSDGRVVSGSADATLRVWDPDRPDTDPIVLTGHTGGTQGVCTLSDGRIVSAGNDRTVRVSDPNRPDADRVVLTGNTDWVRGVCTLSDGRIASASYDGTVRVWDPDRPDDDPVVLTGHTGPVWGVCTLSDGRIASASFDGTVRLWDPDRPPVVKGHTDPVRAVCTLSDGRIASAGEDGTVRVWDTDQPSTDPILLVGHTDWVRGLCALDDGRIVSASDDGTLRVWDPNRPEVDPIVLTGHTRGVVRVCTLSDRLIVSAGANGDDTVRVWDTHRAAADGVVFTGHTGGVWGVCASVDGHVVAADGGTIAIVGPEAARHRLDRPRPHRQGVGGVLSG